MAVKIRFSRIGKKKMPVYRIVAVDERKKRDGAVLENLGTYNPLSSEIIKFDKDRVDAWIAQGAVASDAVKRVYKLYKTQEAKSA